MPYKPLNDEQKKEVLNEMAEAKKKVLSQKEYLAYLEQKLAEGNWYSNVVSIKRKVISSTLVPDEIGKHYDILLECGHHYISLTPEDQEERCCAQCELERDGWSWLKKEKII